MKLRITTWKQAAQAELDLTDDELDDFRYAQMSGQIPEWLAKAVARLDHEYDLAEATLVGTAVNPGPMRMMGVHGGPRV